MLKPDGFELYMLNRPWLVAVIWFVLYTGDHYLTLVGQRFYRAQDVVKYEGSYELTPEHQSDIDNERWFSVGHISWLIGGSLLLLACGYASGNLILYGLLTGAMIIPEVVVHFRHAENILYYRRLCGPSPGVSGALVMSKSFVYANSSWHLAGTGILLLIAYALTGSPTLLGGSAALGMYAYHHSRHAKHFKTAEKSQED